MPLLKVVLYEYAGERLAVLVFENACMIYVSLRPVSSYTIIFALRCRFFGGVQGRKYLNEVHVLDVGMIEPVAVQSRCTPVE